MTGGDAAAAATVVVAGLGALATIAAKLIEKYKPSHERRDAAANLEFERRKTDLEGHAQDIKNLRAKLDVVLGMMEIRDNHATAQDVAIKRHQEEIERMRTEMGLIRRKIGMLYSAIARSQTRFPETREFWDKELAKIEP